MIVATYSPTPMAVVHQRARRTTLRDRADAWFLPRPGGATVLPRLQLQDDEDTTAVSPTVDTSQLTGARAEATKQPAARVLIVEDESIVALDLRITLRRLGYDVVGVAGSCEEAVNVAAQARPDLILMDIRLHGHMDGIQAAALIRSRYGIPVIFLTAQSDETTRKRAEAVSPAGIIMKPFSPADLVGTMSTVLENQRKAREADRTVRT
ncbi:MAG: response regulator [Chloroflexi bacterium]|nr:response regulator [Chloroflexota bacterium]